MGWAPNFLLPPPPPPLPPPPSSPAVTPSLPPSLSFTSSSQRASFYDLEGGMGICWWVSLGGSWKGPGGVEAAPFGLASWMHPPKYPLKAGRLLEAGLDSAREAGESIPLQAAASGRHLPEAR